MTLSPLSRACGVLLLLFLPLGALAGFEDDYEEKPWAEIEVALPAAPRPENLLPFYVSAATDNHFFVDGESLSVGSDGVLRYTLVVDTPAGVRNVSFEGMRCETRERRPYAFGRSNGAWSKTRDNTWKKIQEATSNRQYAALFHDYFCPGGVGIGTADQAKDALKRGSIRRIMEIGP